MTVRVQWDVFCDGPDCYLWVHTDAKSPSGAKREVRAHGWKTEAGLTFCPDCAKERT